MLHIKGKTRSEKDSTWTPLHSKEWTSVRKLRTQDWKWVLAEVSIPPRLCWSGFTLRGVGMVKCIPRQTKEFYGPLPLVEKLYFLWMQTVDWWLSEVEVVGWWWTKWVKRVRKYKLPPRKWICPGDVVYSMVTIVNNIVYFTVAERRGLKSSHYKKEVLTRCGNLLWWSSHNIYKYWNITLCTWN